MIRKTIMIAAYTKSQMEPAVSSEKADSLSALGQSVQKTDPDRFLAALFMPREVREAAFAIIAFNYEIAKTRSVVTEPLLGQIRLQWWREAIDEIAAGKPPRAHEVVQPLAEAVRRHGLKVDLFYRLIDARLADLSGGPVSDIGAYAADTSVPLFQLFLALLGEPERPLLTEPLGRAYALAGLLRALPMHLAEGFCPWPEALLPSPSPEHVVVMAKQVTAMAKADLQLARQAMKVLPRGQRVALVGGALAARYLRQLEACAYDVYAPRLQLAGPGRGLALLWAWLRGRF